MARANELEEIMAPSVSPSAAASASASSSTPTKSVRYDVFINHGGPDTKQTLAASICRALKLMGLEVFLDEPELDFGDSIPSEIQKAIATSFLHIAILSPRYAESTWCLEELSLMLKTSQKVIPVFYNVDVNDIRWIKGIYAEELSKLEGKGRYRSEKLEDWKSALQKVSYLKGYTVKNEDDKEVLKIIASFVRKTPFVVAKHPVGLDETLRDFKRKVLQSSASVNIVGITGMSGCGKTTLAKKYYNKMIRSFYRCSFVYGIRDTPTKNLHEKQKKMFEDLSGLKDTSFDSVEEGKAILAEYLRFVQIFIILDDVDHLDQLDSLLPIKNNLKQGSVIVIISQDSGILTSWGIPSNSIYKMNELNPEHATELFCLHAFQQRCPIDEFEYHVKKFLNVCKGLPLSLKVLGGLVHGKSKEYWDGQLNKFSRLLVEDIKSLLKVSFNGLDEEDREIFLDVSCFFIGTETHSAITVWDESGWSGASSLETLVNKCLVEIDENNCLRMHDLLRDLGKEISKTWSPYRLWSPQQITHIEEQGRESVLIRGIKAHTDEFYEEFMELVRESGRGIKRKRGLKIFDVENNYYTEELATLSASLVSLRWANFPHTALPSWISLKKLRVLEFRGAPKLEQLWGESGDPPVELRVLKISDAGSFLRFPRSIGFLKHLRKISFNSEGAPIEGLPEEFCRLQSLECLEVVGCHMLKSLPDKFGDLKNLQNLSLKECTGIESLSEEFGRLQSLKYLELSECHELKLLPSKMGDLTNLQHLELKGCSKLMITSETIAQLTSLYNLRIVRCPRLTELVIQPGCFSSSFCSLKSISLCFCHVFRISISQQCCPSLEILRVISCHDLLEINSLPISVKQVELIECSNLESISFNCGLVRLEHLNIRQCGKLSKIEGLENCRSLDTLTAYTCSQEPPIQSLKDMESLRSVSLTSACHISAFEHCLQTINREKWPRQCIICGRIAPGMEAMLKSFTVPGLTLVDSLDRQKMSSLYRSNYWQYVFLEEDFSNENAAMICLVINSTLDVLTLDLDCIDINSLTQVKKGKWLWIGVFSVSSPVGSEVKFFLFDDELGSESAAHLEIDCVKMGMLVRGEESKVVGAFYGLLQHLGKEGDICEGQ